MNDKQPPEKSVEEIINELIGEVASAEGADSDTLTPDDLRKLADEMELLKADFGNWESYKAAATEYVEEFTKEVKWHRLVRLWVSVAGGLLVAFLAILLVCGVSKATTIFGDDPGNALTALVVGCIGGCVIVTIALIKGAFSNLADRNAGLPMPERTSQV